MEGSDLIGEHAVFVHKEAEASLLLQQSLFTSIRNEQLHVHLSARQSFQTLMDKEKSKYQNKPYIVTAPPYLGVHMVWSHSLMI